MNKIEILKILVPIDFTETSEIALAEAIALAKKLKAEIFLLHVIESNGYFTSIFPESGILLPSIEEIKKAVKKKMDAVQIKAAKKGEVHVHAFVVSGHIHTEIINFSKKKNIDLIVMGTHGASGYEELFIGSNAQQVVTLSEKPVITIRDKKSKLGFKNILIPIDDSLHSREKVNMAMIVAKAFGSRIHLVGLPVSKNQDDINKINIKLHSVEDVIKSEKLPYNTTIIHGSNLAKTANKYATENQCDLIVVNTGHESRLTGIFLGAFAQQIVNHATVPVLSFKHMKDHYSLDGAGYGGV